MPTDPKLRLPTDATTGLFRVLDRQLRADPALASAVKTWRSWEGNSGDKTPPGLSQCPWVRLTPRYGPLEWWAASTQTGWLFVRAELWVAGSCFDDLANLWGALQRAVYPADAAGRLALQARLRAAGAHTGLVKFNLPVLTSDPQDDDHIEGEGWLALEYRFDANPTAPGF